MNNKIIALSISFIVNRLTLFYYFLKVTCPIMYTVILICYVKCVNKTLLSVLKYKF